ncbi:pentapeptide repeat-containing protein [Yoonia sp.]|uniref:pentapeptide repeat-containing protein n=1 Tax=Yoonia sp. TaxID=2212373 RepID=UPI00358F041A
MMRLIEDILTPAELEAIELVSRSETPRFDRLVELSGLDPAQDFTYSDLRRLNLCGADLRGFDFTGSDLRMCARNDRTIIDASTILTDTKTNWIELEALPIVMKMQEVEAASGSDRRIAVLNELIAEFGKSAHVVTYMVSAASKAESLDEFIDFALFLPSIPSEEHAQMLKVAAEKLLKKRLSRSRSRTRRDTTMVFALEAIAARLREGEGTLAAKIFGYLAEIADTKNQSVQLGGTYNIERADLERAFARIGQ